MTTPTAPLPGPTTADCARAYVEQGLCLIPIPHGKKGPTSEGWNRPENCVTDPDVAARTWTGEPRNMGVLLGASRLATIDVDNVELTRVALAAVGIDYDDLMVGTLRIIGNPANAKALFRLPLDSELSMRKLVFPPQTAAGKAITVFELRTGPVQDVLPPSVHPSGRIYEWNRPWWNNGGIPEIGDTLLSLWQRWDELHPRLLAACPWAKEPSVTSTGRSMAREYSRTADVESSWSTIRCELRARIPLEGMLEEIGAVRRGNKYLCPFHNEKNPSFWIFDGGEGYTLWCDAHGAAPVGHSTSQGYFVGDVIDLYQFKEGFATPGEATAALARREGIPLPGCTPTVAVMPVPAQDPPAETKIVFPPEVLTGAAGEFARLYAAHLEAPTHFFFMSFLTCLGSVVSDRLTLRSELAPQPRLYTLLLGESADDRKSTAISKTVEFFRTAIQSFTVCWGVGSAEGLQARMEKENRLLLALDEFRQFVSKSKIEASVLLPCVTTLFESNRYESHTKQSSILLERAHLSLLAASTISTYENTWSSQFTDIGFNNRLWLVPGGAERRFSIPEKASEIDRYRVVQMLAAVLEHIDRHRELDITPKAKALFHTWYMELPRSIYTKRLDTYAMRLMSLLAVNDLKPEVDEETILKVMLLCDHQFKVRQLHDPIDADNEAAKLEEKIRRVLAARGRLSDRDLKRHVHADRKGLWLYETAKGNLQRSGELRFDRKTNTLFLAEATR